FAGLKRLLNDDARSNRLRQRLEAGDIESLDLTPRERLALTYTRELTLRPAEMTALLIEELRGSGFEDGEILEINQVAAYFNYANRTVLGLGTSTDGDILGLSPGNSQDPDDWRHG
ncbi:MAG: alkylhydroperoxidase, partial [Pseudomonadota bacterium]|nr:alkylhydroperoxidase [Pseudomonadota bacterium]